MTTIMKIATVTALVLSIMQPHLSYAAAAGMPCEKNEVGKTEIDNDKKNVIGCLVTDDEKSQIWKAFSGINKSFSVTCEDWESAGWESKDACIMDGRWHLVYSNDARGNTTFGSLREFKKYSDQGADVNNSDYNGDSQHICQTVVWKNGMVLCLDGFRVQGEPWRNDIQANDKTNGLGAGVRRSDGARISSNIIPKDDGSLDLHVFPTYAGVAFNWFVKF